MFNSHCLHEKIFLVKFWDQLNAVTEAHKAMNCEEVVFARLEEH